MELFCCPFVFLTFYLLIFVCLSSSFCLFVLKSLWPNVSRVSSIKSHYCVQILKRSEREVGSLKLPNTTHILQVQDSIRLMQAKFKTQL